MDIGAMQSGWREDRARFERILLEDVQKELLVQLVEAARNVPLDKREKFFVIRVDQGTFIHHPGLSANAQAYIGDIETLDREGLLAITDVKQTPTFDVTPLGFAYYDYLKESGRERSGKSEKGGMTEKEVLEVIEEAARNGRKELDLSSRRMKSLPGTIGQLANLRELQLGGNELTELPPELGQLANLQGLYVGGNQLTKLPAEIGKLTELENLAVGQNKLTELPPELGQLAKLRQLGVGGNQLRELPAELGQLGNLEMLFVGGNPLEWPPLDVVERGTEAVLTYLREELKRGEGGDGGFEKVFRENFIAFLITEKKFPRESLNHGILAEVPDLDLTVTHPDTDSILAIFNFKSVNYGKNFPKLSEIMAKTHKIGFVGKYNPFVYIVHPSEESNEGFVILEVEDDATANEISYENFPFYDQLLFASPLSDQGRRIYNALNILAKDKHGFIVHTPCQDYIDLQIKKNKRVAVQIHRLSDSDDNISFVLAGYQQYFPEPKLPNYMFEGELKQLSGYTSKYPGEKNWLDGNLGHKQLKYEAGVYILRPGALVLDEIENEVGGLLELAKSNAESKGAGEATDSGDEGEYHVPIMTYSGDGVRDPEGRLVDQLGIEAEVNAMSSLVAARDIKWPLSIGLFGDWGSGKSFFMEMMRERIERISEESRKWVRGGKESAYCTNVVQIRFNAWHYMDANLWASLVTHIFEELARQMSGDKEEDLARTKEKLFGQLESAKELKKEAQEKKRKAAELRKEAEDKLGKAEKERADAAQELANLTGRDVVALAKEDPRIREEFAKIADTLGLDKIAPAADDLREVVSQGRDLFGRVSLIWRTISSRRKGKIKLLVVIGLILGLPVLAGLVVRWFSNSAFTAQLTGVIGLIVSGITSHMTALKPRLARINKGLAQWEKTQEEILKISAEKTQQRNEEELRIRREIENLKERERAAEADVERAEELEDEASGELEEIKTGRRLFRFIEERSRKSEYKEKLGIIALIREDFELLSKLVSKSSEEAAGDDLPRVDRIVLYVDDLDRCPSQRVVEVLQAVHLILGFELFVVVVAVDSRWILHALHEEYSAFGGVDKVTARLGSRWLTTPQNYVEKIFQIPFALRPMEDRGYRQLVENLVERRERDDEESTMEGPEIVEREQRTGEQLERQITSREEKEIRMDEFKPTIEMRPPSANLSEQEAEFMKAMGDLIPSPRAAKRFVNIYRLTLASVDDRGKLSELRGTENRPGDYQAVLLMLAILTGFPGQGADILKTLANGDRKYNGILDFVSKLKTRKEPNSEPARYSNGVRKGILEAERAVWDKLSNILKERIEELGVRDSLEPFVRWAGWVARFSFQYKPMISEEEGAEKDG